MINEIDVDDCDGVVATEYDDLYLDGVNVGKIDFPIDGYMSNTQLIVKVPGRPCQEGNMTAVKGHVFHANDSKLKTYRSLVGNAMFNEMKKHNMHIAVSAVSIDVTFWFARPKSHFTTKGRLSSCYQSRHTTRPDTDKLIRAVLDALTGIAYRDDSQVDHITAQKKYGTEPHTTIKLSMR